MSGDGSENICVPCGGNREAHDEEQVLLRECHGHDAVQAKLDERCPWRLKKVLPRFFDAPRNLGFPTTTTPLTMSVKGFSRIP